VLTNPAGDLWRLTNLVLALMAWRFGLAHVGTCNKRHSG
jgi:hypothetical protein